MIELIDDAPVVERSFPKSGFSRWDVSLDEIPGSKDSSLLIDCAAFYVCFRVTDLSSIGKAAELLENEFVLKRTRGSDVELGLMGNLPVTLVQDREDFPRCFLIAGTDENGVLRIPIVGNDLKELSDALSELSEE